MWDREEVNPPVVEKFLFSKIPSMLDIEGKPNNFPEPLFSLLP